MAEVQLDRDGIIQVMSPILANKIAAGEVVQRPSSVVKELIENAIDAGATKVDVLVKSAGKELIQVVDDGSGMSRTDAERCFSRHATSKIRSIEDLDSIRTLGFRGEALASIAAVGRVELRTKRKGDDAGTVVQVEGGVFKKVGPCATADGTSVAVRNLFFNVPARRNFLKTAATELKHIVETVQFLALANPGLAVSLHNDRSEMLHVGRAEGDDPVLDRIKGVFGDDVGDNLVRVEETTSYLSLHGFVGRPEYYRKSPGEQFLFVNERIVRSRYINHAVRKAFGDSLPEAAYPFFVLYLDLDPKHVDVNVHPTKAEIKFDDEAGVYGFVKAVVRRTLGVADLYPQLSSDEDVAGFMPTVFNELDRESQSQVGSRGGPGSRGYGDDVASRRSAGGSWTDAFYGRDASVGPSNRIERLERRGPDDSARFWQIDDTYIVTPMRSGVLIVDQNAAHQRVLYEKAVASLASRQGLSQQLLFPETFEFAPGDYEMLVELMPDLNALGFEIEEFGGRSIIVRGIPSDLRESTTPHILRDLLAQFQDNMSSLRVDAAENLARSIARKGATRHGTKLDPTEMRSLLDQLFLCESPFVAPDDRPTMIRISAEELARRFGR